MSKRKSCSVPKCLVTATRNPEKHFFSSPSDLKRRDLWLNRMKRDKKSISPNTVFYVCEDHFDIEHDLENYIKFKYSEGRGKHLLKKETVPHIFECQIRESEYTKPNVSSQKSKVRPAALKINQRRLVNEYITSSSACTVEENLRKDTVPFVEQIKQVPPILKMSKSIQCNLRKKFKSHSVQCTLLGDNSYLNPECEVVIEEQSQMEDISFSTASVMPQMSEYSQFSTDEALKEIVKKSEEIKNREAYVQHTLFLCQNKSKQYLGIDPGAFHIIDILCELLQCKETDIFIVLLKIRKNYSFEEIGDMFGTHQAYITEKFNKMLPKICDCIKHFIKWPSVDRIQAALPIAFQLNYNNVQIIINCFEIQIQKPPDPKLQALTWSEYKKANTIKYLIGSTPNGMIIYISKGFGGRTSDLKIVKESGFLEVLPKKCCVMADRGFKGIDTLLHPLDCTLIRPPSVSAGLKLTKEEVLTKQVASLRIHIEQVINRLREFHLLKPHASVNHSLLKYLDQSVIIACGIVNLQSELIKSE